MSTIKELAETCGVSEQAIRKWCARNQVAKDVAQRYIIDKTTETAILQHYGKDTRNQVAQPTETSCETSETMKEIIEMLRKELEAKDKQIEEPATFAGSYHSRSCVCPGEHKGSAASTGEQ